MRSASGNHGYMTRKLEKGNVERGGRSYVRGALPFLKIDKRSKDKGVVDPISTVYIRQSRHLK